MPSSSSSQSSRMGAPAVSIIMPIYNAEEFIEEAIRSAQAQSYTDWELVVADDCSTDESIRIVKAMADKDARIRLVQLPTNVGSTECRFAALKAAKGRFMAFLDADDVWMPEKLERQISLLKNSSHALCCTSYALMSHSGRRLSQIRRVKARSYGLNYILKNNVIGCLTAVVDTQKTGPIHMDNSRWTERSRGDYILWLNALQNGRTAVGIPEVLAVYRLSRNSVSSKKILAAGSMWRVLRYNRKLPLHVAAFYFASYALLRIPRVFERLLAR